MIATAALATGVGFLVLLLSPVPMVRGFGALLVAGIAIAFAARADRRARAALALRAARRRAGALAARRRRAGRERGARLGARARAAGAARRRRGGARRRCGGPGRCSRSALAVAALGWAVDSRTEVVSDIERLVPQDLPAVQDLQALQQATGVAGEIDVVVEGHDLTEPGGREVDARLPVRRCSSATATRPSAAAGGPSCARRCRCPTCSAPRQSAERPRADPRAARRGAAVLLQRGDHRATARRPTSRSGSGSRRSSASSRSSSDMRERLDPPQGVTRPARRPAGAGRRGERDAVGPAAAARDARGRPARRARSCCCSCTARRGWRRARGRGRGCRSCRSRSRPAGRRSCCGCSACR